MKNTNRVVLSLILIVLISFTPVISIPAKGAQREVEEEINTEAKEEEQEKEVLLEHFFQDIFSEQLSPHKIQFGHVFEDPKDWEQRFEERDFSANRHKGKVKWGNDNGAYGEHYWDLNH